MNHGSNSKNSIDFAHRRRNPLTGDWVLVSTDRLQRPWQGAHDKPQDSSAGVEYDSACYLCPGNQRAEGDVNPQYSGVFVFDNDYPALPSHSSRETKSTHPLFTWSPVSGVCRVICFSPNHSHTLSDLTLAEVAAVVNEWSTQSMELGQRFPHGSVQIFENKGQIMGCSSPHPHGQIWAQQSIPSLLKRELGYCQRYKEITGAVLLPDYVSLEMLRNERVVFSNEHFVVLVPYWAAWPFETLICPRRHIAQLSHLKSDERVALADAIRRLSIRYDALFNVSFPYSAGLHQAPASGVWDGTFTLHMHFYPPLLRSAEVRKFMVGYEMLAEPQRDLTPEEACRVLRELPDGA